MPPVAPGTAVVVLSARLGAVLPAAALPVLLGAAAVYTDIAQPLAGAQPVPDGAAGTGKLAAQAAVEPVVLLTSDPTGPAAAALAGAPVITVTEPVGAALLDAVAVMDRLRSPGGCPWDAEQTHASLGQYLVEECYELLDAIGHGDPAALREELGDVLLQVLFHARIAAEGGVGAFDVDDVASELVTKLVGRHPHVFAGSETLATAAEQETRWEELKRAEKQRSSAVDGVPLGLPAVALAAKLVSRAHRAGLPADLLPGLTPVAAGNDAASAGGAEAASCAGGAVDAAGVPDAGVALFVLAARTRLAGRDPEAELRAVALRFAADVRAAEDSARAAGEDPATLTPTSWRRHFPS
jgi:XTP/dITP diphosphohydrolase